MSDDIEKEIEAKFPHLKNQARSAGFSEIGTTGLNRWGQDVYEEFIPSLRWPRAGLVYKEMSHNDPVITAILLVARHLIRKVTWSVKAGGDSAVDRKAAEFLESCRMDMSMSWPELIDEITSYFEYGWSYHEIVYKKRLGADGGHKHRSKYNDGLIGWRKLAPRSQESWAGWEFDEEDDGNLKGMFQEYRSIGDGPQVYIPIEKSLLFRTTSNRGNPEGRSFLRGAYRPWYFKKHIEEIEGIGIERDLAGLPVIKTPENVDIWDPSNDLARQQKQAAESLVKNIRQDKNQGVVLPYGWDLQLLSASGSKQFDTSQIINRYDQRIAITLLADIVMLGADKVGSFALAEVKKSLLAAALDTQVQNIANIFNRYAVPRLFELNPFYGMTKLPEIIASPVDTPNLRDLAEYISKLAGAKMPLFPDIDLENYLRTLANLPTTSEEADDREETRSVARGNSSTSGNTNTTGTSQNKEREE